MRDSIKSKDYYEEIYESDTDDILYEEESLRMILEGEGKTFENLPLCYPCLAVPYFLRFYVGYTMGKTYKELLPDVEKYIENESISWNGKNYEELVVICSLAILFNIRNEYIENLLKKSEARLNNCLYGEMFIKLIQPSWEIKADKIYSVDDKALVEVIQLAQSDREAAVQRLKKFVDKQWFRTLKEGIITNKSRCYRGYWCIEAAALVKALELDDTELRDCKYYPYDMAHFC